MYIRESTITLIDSVFAFNKAGENGGAIILLNSVATFHVSEFYRNSAGYEGGAIAARDSSIALSNASPNASHNITLLAGVEGSCFEYNSAFSQGGAIHICRGTITLSDNSVFHANNARLRGGAITAVSTNFSVRDKASFQENRAHLGGALYFADSDVILRGDILFKENSADTDGGGIFASAPKGMSITANFVDNTAEGRGGCVWIKGGGKYTEIIIMSMVSSSFINNTATKCGGAVYVGLGLNVHFVDMVATGNSNSAFCIFEDSSVFFSGSINISGNSGYLGGAIQTTSQESYLSFGRNTVFHSNRANIGGAIYSTYETTISFDGFTLFQSNIAEKDGGGVYALGTNIFADEGSTVLFSHNSAENGGAMHFDGKTVLRFAPRVNLSTFNNRALQYGGGLFVEDTAIITQCNFNDTSDMDEVNKLPYCFFKLERLSGFENNTMFGPLLARMHSEGDLAGKGGNFMYGGLLDRCKLSIRSVEDSPYSNVVPFESTLFNVKKADKTKEITSQAYQLCFCIDNSTMHECPHFENVNVHRGQKFSLSLFALDQMRASISTQVFAKVSSKARLQLSQSSQTLLPNCSLLTYTVFSLQDHEELVLVPEGPCNGKGLSRAVVNVTLRRCPVGFEQNGEKCECDRILRDHGVNCTLDEGVTILKKSGSKFWVRALYEDERYLGLSFYKSCPLEYCKAGSVNISLDNPDVQCDVNRSGVLCGSCRKNYSLMLGSSRCEECSNVYLALLLSFAAAGIALVVFLSVLRLTVATGMINSIILYANIVQANKRLYFPSDNNVFSVFIAWMNLDLGIETCFYDSMTALAPVCLSCLCLASNRHNHHHQQILHHCVQTDRTQPCSSPGHSPPHVLH